jgi:hypothetical protein
MLSAGFLAAVQNRGKGTNQKASFHTEWLSNQIRRFERNRPIRQMMLSDWFLFLYSDWWMSDRLKYSYSVPVRTVW